MPMVAEQRLKRLNRIFSWVAPFCMVLAIDAMEPVCAEDTMPESAAGSTAKLDALIERYTRAIESKHLSTEHLAITYYNRGTGYGSTGQDDLAIQDFNEAIHLKPDFAEAFYNLGTIYGRDGQTDRAVENFNQAILLKPDYAEAYNNRGYAYTRMGQDDRAIADFNEAARLKPDFAAAYNNRGYAYARKGQDDMAIRSFYQAIGFKPGADVAGKDRDAPNGNEAQDDKELLEFYQTIRLKPDIADAFAGLGFMHFYAGRFSKAEPNLRVASNSDPGNAYRALWLYLAMSRQNKDGRAELAARAPKFNLTAWPGPIVQFYLNQRSVESVLKAVAKGKGENHRGQLCEADFYLGEHALLEKNQERAKQLMREAADICPSTYIELTGAQEEIKLHAW
jgi:lipoprotein NlpI